MFSQPQIVQIRGKLLVCTVNHKHIQKSTWNEIEQKYIAKKILNSKSNGRRPITFGQHWSDNNNPNDS